MKNPLLSLGFAVLIEINSFIFSGYCGGMYYYKLFDLYIRYLSM